MKPFFEARQLTYQHQRGPLAVRGVSLDGTGFDDGGERRQRFRENPR